MGKTEQIQETLHNLLVDTTLSREEKFTKLSDYAVSNSNLPGRRANLELAAALKNLSKIDDEIINPIFVEFIDKYILIDADQAPTNNPREFLPFCATWVAGSIVYTQPDLFEKSLSQLKTMAKDSRWRIREAVSKGLCELIEYAPRYMIDQFLQWLEESDFLMNRAIAASVADVVHRGNIDLVTEALMLHERIFEWIVSLSKPRNGEDFKTLRKALAYTWSVCIAKNPEIGRDKIKQYLNYKDPDIQWIVKENLKKKRLKDLGIS